MPATPFVGEISIFGFNFNPVGWVFCNGQLLPIAQFDVLFALIGTTYGGDGQTTFAVPDLRSRMPVHFGQGPGLSNYQIGEQSGQENVTILPNQLPLHNHTSNAVSEAGDVSAPIGAYLANTGALDKEYKTSGAVVAMNANVVGVAGGSQPHNNIKPYAALNYCIAFEGIFPSRN
jgi:microcystin-dependent protein